MKPIVIGFVLILSAQCVFATSGKGIDRLNDFLDGLETLEAKFEQTVLDTETSQTGLYQGIFMLNRPKKFRWDYVVPYEQAVIADGRHVWVVDKDLEQISKQHQPTALKGTPAKVLMEGIGVEDEYEVIDLGERVGFGWLELLPKDQDNPFIRILLAFDETSLRRMEMTDQFGKITRFRFFEVKRNPGFDPEIFEVKPPEGFDFFEH